MKKTGIILLFLFVSVFNVSIAQTNEKSPYITKVNPKVGFYVGNSWKTTSGSNMLGVAFGVGLNFKSNNKIHSVALTRLVEFRLFSNKHNSYNQLDYLFGVYKDEKRIRFYYQIGIGIMGGNERVALLKQTILNSTYGMKSFFRVTIPVRLAIKKIIKSGNSIGVDFNLNLSNKGFLLSPTFSVEF